MGALQGHDFAGHATRVWVCPWPARCLYGFFTGLNLVQAFLNAAVVFLAMALWNFLYDQAQPVRLETFPDRPDRRYRRISEPVSGVQCCP
jgi:hypothetical protein